MTDKATSEKGTGNRTGGSAVVEALERHGARHVFGVPGESFLSFLDAVRGSGLRFVNFRQEGGAAMCAEATGKITGKAGVAYVTRAPGATNASSGTFVYEELMKRLVGLTCVRILSYYGRPALRKLGRLFF